MPAEDWIFQINKCRAAIAGAVGPEATYLTSLEVTVDTEIDATIQSLLTGCQGRLIESGGTYKIRVGEPGASVFQFSDADILSTEEQSFTPFFGLSETINGVSATYPEPDEAWNTKTAPPLFNADYEVEDGARRLFDECHDGHGLSVDAGAADHEVSVGRGSPRPSPNFCFAA